MQEAQRSDRDSGATPKLGGRSGNGGASKSTNSGFEMVGGKSNGEVASYLFQRQGVATSFSKTVVENDKGNFSGQRWSSVSDGMSTSEQAHSENGELDDLIKELDDLIKGRIVLVESAIKVIFVFTN